MEKFCGSLLSVLLWIGLGTTATHAQVTPDGTLSTMVTSTDSLNFTIENGNTAGTNLFHSFDDFSVPTGGSAIFNNATDIDYIFGRVTGRNLSDIDGLIQANGNANLFLINPNGIQFGTNASLNIGGSFVASSGDRILFDDDTFFSASDTTAPALLSISAPIGLQLGDNPGSLQVNGPGNLSFVNPLTGETDDSNRPLGLSLATGQTLALVGGEITLQGGNITTIPGRIELGSVGANETVNITADASGLTLDYEDVETFQDISLLAAAAVLATGGSQSELRVQARHLTLTDGSALSISSTNSSPLSGGLATIHTSESVNILGATFALPTSIGATIGSGADGDGGTIIIDTGRLLLTDGGLLNATTASAGNAGDIFVTAEDIEVSGLNPNSPFPAAIGTVALPQATGSAGNLTIEADSVLVRNGGAISSATFGVGSAGDVKITADRIELREFAQQGELANTGIFSSVSFVDGGEGIVGDGGDIILDTSYLSIADGLQISASSQGQGRAGDIQISADRIELTGRSPEPVPGAVFQDVQPSSIVAAGFGVGSNAGSITIDANEVSLEDGAVIAVSGLILGDAGDLQINASNLSLSTGVLQANTSSGSGGNIVINSDTIVLQQNSGISTNATGDAIGGNITIDTENLVAVPGENSDISANAQQSFGGQIDITAQSIVGTQFRPQLTLLNDITASSELGATFSGTVTITTPDVDPGSGLTELPTGLVDSSDQIAQGCASGRGNMFTLTGRGGLAALPTKLMDGDRPWADIRDLSAFLGHGDGTSPPTSVRVDPRQDTALTEAMIWHTNADGDIELSAFHAAQPDIHVHATCAART